MLFDDARQDGRAVDGSQIDTKTTTPRGKNAYIVDGDLGLHDNLGREHKATKNLRHEKHLRGSVKNIGK